MPLEISVRRYTAAAMRTKINFTRIMTSCTVCDKSGALKLEASLTGIDLDEANGSYKLTFRASFDSWTQTKSPGYHIQISSVLN